jgi:hypothetical protein
MQEAANCLERVRQLPWQELTAARLSQIELSAAAQARLPSADLQIAAEPTDEADAVKVRVQIGWHSRQGGTPLEVALVTWRYNREAAP